MTAVDRLGFHVRSRIAEGMPGARMVFRQEVRDETEARSILLEMVKQSRSQGRWKAETSF